MLNREQQRQKEAESNRAAALRQGLEAQQRDHREIEKQEQNRAIEHEREVSEEKVVYLKPIFHQHKDNTSLYVHVKVYCLKRGLLSKRLLG